MTILDPLVIAQLGNLRIRARKLLEGLYSGRHLNRNRGSSKEFSEHRPYNPGDDLRALDWKIFGKTDRLVLKQFDEETSLAGLVALDPSASMNYRTGNHPSKLEYAKTMAAALGYLLVAQHDAVGLLSESVTLPPRNQKGFLDLFFETLSGIDGKGRWDLASLPLQVANQLKKPGLLMILTDLMQDTGTIETAFKAFHSRKHDIMVFQILDPSEKDLTATGSILFEDVETGEKIKTEPEAIRQAYREFVEKKLAETSHFFKGLGIEHVVLTTDTPFNKGLGTYLSWREAHL